MMLNIIALLSLALSTLATADDQMNTLRCTSTFTCEDDGTTHSQYIEEVYTGFYSTQTAAMCSELSGYADEYCAPFGVGAVSYFSCSCSFVSSEPPIVTD